MFHEDTHVGFLVSAEDRPRAAIDTDHQWTRPIWTARDLSRAELVDLDVVGYVVNDIVEAETGYPILCGDLAASRRYPR